MIRLRDLVARLRIRHDKQAGQQAEGEVRSSFDRIGQAAKRLGAIIGAAFALRVITRFARGAVEAFHAIERETRLVQNQVENLGVAWDDADASLKALTDQLWHTHRLTGGEILPLFRTLINVTGDYETALNSVGLAADMGAQLTMDNATAARYLGRILNGETTALRRYGITLDENRDLLEQLTERFSGAARASVNGADAARKAWGDFREELGRALSIILEVEAGGEGLADVIRRATDWLKEHEETWRSLGRTVVSVSSQVVRTIEGWGKLWRNVQRDLLRVEIAILRVNRAIALWGRGRVQQNLDDAIKRLRDLERAALRAEEALSEAAGGGRPGTPPPRPTPDGESRSDEIEKEIRLLGQARELNILTSQDIQRIFALEQQTREELVRGNLELARRVELVARLNELEGLSAGLVGQVSDPRIDMAQSDQRLITRAFESIAPPSEHIRTFADAWIEANQDILWAVETTSMGVTQAWEDAFDTLFKEGEGFAEFMEALGRGMGAALLAGLSDYAQQKQQAALAEAISQTALGVGAAAWGNMASASAHFKSAATHTAAAMAWAALAGGAASGASAARSGGRGGGGVSGASDIGGGVAARAQRPGADITINFVGPGFDALNPAVQSVVMGAIQEATETAGAGARVRVNKRAS